MQIINKSFFLVIFILMCNLYAVEPDIIERSEDWTFEDVNTTQSGVPSDLKFLKYYDVLPDEISINILNNRDLSRFEGKRVYVGYGTVDPRGENCRIFPPETTGMDHNVTICLPWWRIERTYQKSLLNIKDNSDILCIIPTPHPPIKVNVCKEWINDGSLSTEGGKVTCTSYYNRLESTDCWNNPRQQQCFVDNCSIYVKNNCEEVGSMIGEKDSIETAEYIGQTYTPVETKIDVLTHQYECPAGSMVPYTECKEDYSVMMYPYQCEPDDPNTFKDESVYIYCDENQPVYTANGSIDGFLGKCPVKDENGNITGERTVQCDVNSFSQTSRICEEPINIDINTTSYNSTVEEKHYREYTVDVLSGETDVYAEKPNCLRSNTVASGRQSFVYAHIVGSGTLDDDIWVVKHKGDGTHSMVYCNEQHNKNAGSKKVYDGVEEQCIGNDGHYSFDRVEEIQTSDIVSVQEATESEDSNPTIMYGRTHYCSTEVRIDNKIIAPQAFFNVGYSYYQGGGNCYDHANGVLKLWENTLGTLSILFPYSGAYRLSFYDKNGNLLAEHDITMEDFNNIANSDYIQLKIAKEIQHAPGIDYDSNTSCLDDDWTEIGGGIYGNKNAEGQNDCVSPNDSYVKAHAIYRIIVKDLLTGNITPIPLVYPLAYPNRIFISKLKLYEQRKYRCYDDFTANILQ